MQLDLGLGLVNTPPTASGEGIQSRPRRKRKRKRSRILKNFDLFKRPLYNEEELYWRGELMTRMDPLLLQRGSTEHFLRQVQRLCKA